MVDHPVPVDYRMRRATRAAILVTLLALAMLGWEAAEKPASARPATLRAPVASRGRFHRTSARKTIAAAPAEVIEAVPPPPPPPEPVAAPVDPATLRLSEIVIDPADPAVRFAVIDGVAVRAGETIGGHPVREVLPDRVLIGNQRETALFPAEEDR